MATNMVNDSVRGVRITATSPATPTSGDAVLMEDIGGVALNDEEADGTVIADLGPAIYNLPVHGFNATVNTAIAAGERIYFDSAVPELNVDDTNGVYFGIALAVVNSGATTTIPVAIGIGQAPAGA